MTRTFAYVGCAESQDIHQFELEADGTLAPVAVTQVLGPPGRGFSTPMATSPDRKFLYVALRSKPFSFVTFAIDPGTGRLSPLGSAALADETCYIATDRGGRWLFSASYQGSKIAIGPIGEDGVARDPRTVIATKPSAHCIVPDPSNRFVLHTSLGGDVVYQRAFNVASGEFPSDAPAETHVPAKAGPRHVVFSPDTRFVYVIGELDARSSSFRGMPLRDALRKDIQIVSTLPPGFSGTPSAADIHLTPDGRFLYASERGSNTLAAFAVDRQSGHLTAIGHYPTETQPRGFAIDPAGRVLLAAGQKSHGMTHYTIEPRSGVLSAVGQYPVGLNPNWIEFVALG